MDFNDYQKNTRGEAIYSDSKAFEELSLGLNDKVGSISEEIRSAFKSGVFDEDSDSRMSENIRDCFWFITRICDEKDFLLEDILDENFDISDETDLCSLSVRLNKSTSELSYQICINGENDKIRFLIAESIYYLERLSEELGTNIGEILRDFSHSLSRRQWSE